MHIHQVRHQKIDIVQSFADNNTGIQILQGSIVGRNGSGKSNFFFAIRFVLGDAYSSKMTAEERQALLHEGAGISVLTAWVEIIFDNSDKRFPTGKDTVTIRRSIGLKKDEYLLDKKSSTKFEIQNLLQSAGFSKSNPYYIVPQGRVTFLTNASDEQRLEVLKEVAGTKVYETHRQESLKILDETEQKRQKINELLSFIEERLVELDQEKEELKEYYEIDKDKRSIEYVLLNKEQESIQLELDQLEAARKQFAQENETLLQDQKEREALIQEKTALLKTAKRKADMLNIEKQQLEKDKAEYIKASANLEFAIKELETKLENQMSQKELDSSILILTSELNEKESELADLKRAIAESESEIDKINEQLNQNERKREALLAKKSRGSQFKNQKQRDDWIRTEISVLEKSITDVSAKSRSAEAEIEDLKSKKSAIDQRIEMDKEKNQKYASEINEIAREINDLKEKRDELTDKRKTLWREEMKMTTQKTQLTSEITKNERSIFGMMDRATSAGISFIKNVINNSNLEGVYGPVYDLFEVEELYQTAVDTVAGQSLFHIVVEDDQVASKLLDLMAKEKSGRVTFIPLNRIKAKNQRKGSDQVLYLMDALKISDAKLKPVFEQIFGKYIVCEDLAVGSELAKSYSCNAVTLQGDKSDRKGAITGGYIDFKRNRITSIREQRELSLKLVSNEREYANVATQLETLDQEITNILNELQALERRKKTLSDEHLDQASLQDLIRLRDKFLKAIDSQDSNLREFSNTLRTLNQQKDAFESELATKMSQKLSATEESELSKASSLITSILNDLRPIIAKKNELLQQKVVLENEINLSLKKRLNNLKYKRQNQEIEIQKEELDSKKRALNLSNANIQRISDSESAMNDQLEQYSDEIRELNQVIETVRNHAITLNQQLDSFHKDSEQNLSNRSLLLVKKDEIARKIRDLGGVNVEEAAKYSKQTEKTLVKQLSVLVEKAKKHAHVNKKAFEQYTSFTTKRDNLRQRKLELDEADQAIQEFIEVLDQRKDEAISSTFNTVAENFEQVFEKLVPQGRGKILSPYTGEAADDGKRVLKGLVFQVSFNSKTDEGLLMQQLSGGQKSLVALAFIFSIQKCDPAPFYLFDEIDANLDAAHRTCVAQMINELSKNAQFITTTFRPELINSADKCYGVTFNNKLSNVQVITKEEALAFVEKQQQVEAE